MALMSLGIHFRACRQKNGEIGRKSRKQRQFAMNIPFIGAFLDSLEP
jgi:hypothetical protein